MPKTALNAELRDLADMEETEMETSTEGIERFIETHLKDYVAAEVVEMLQEQFRLDEESANRRVNIVADRRIRN